MHAAVVCRGLVTSRDRKLLVLPIQERAWLRLGRGQVDRHRSSHDPQAPSRRMRHPLGGLASGDFLLQSVHQAMKPTLRQRAARWLAQARAVGCQKIKDRQKR
jgi:hypothetical protein